MDVSTYHFLGAGGIAVLSCFCGAFNIALQNLSRSRLEDLLKNRNGDGSVCRFMRNILQGDDSAYLSSALLHSAASSAFLIYTLLAIVMPLAEISGAPERTAIWAVAVVVVIQMLIRSVATLLGDANSEKLVLNTWWLAWLLSRPLHYPTLFILKMQEVVFRSIGKKPENEDDKREEEVIAAVSDGTLDGVVEEDQRAMIESIFEFKDSDVADIITPRTEMVSVEADEDLGDVIKLALEKGHSRLPVHEETRDNVIGVFYVRDALKYWDEEDDKIPRLRELLRKPLFVPETKKVHEMLQEMQKNKIHFAIVLDEYGGTAGLVTIEDVLEEIVGEIQDEFDTEDDGDEITVIDKHRIVAEGWAHVSSVNEALDVDIIPEQADYETIGGFVLDNLGHIPAPGESFDFKSLNIKVLAADERKVEKVEIVFNPEHEENT